MTKIIKTAVLPLVILLVPCFSNGIPAAYGYAQLHSRHHQSSQSHKPTKVVSKSRKRGHRVVVYKGSRKYVTSVGRGSRRRRHHVVARVHYAYPANFFMMSPPVFQRETLPDETALRVRRDFNSGVAANYPPQALVSAGVVNYYPLHGGIFWRREPVKYVIMHSTETGIPQDAMHVINSWGSGGRRHAGAQYVVDRDGQIYQAVDPSLGTVHVNIFKTLPGINNDNSIGIEMVHCGHQGYTSEQRLSAARLAGYLLDRYDLDLDHLVTHRYAQRGDHTDPVAFDWDGFVNRVADIRKKQMTHDLLAIDASLKEYFKKNPGGASALQPAIAAPTTTFLQIHGKMKNANKAAEVKAVDVKSADIKSDDNTTDTRASDAKSNNSAPALRGPLEVEPDAAKVLMNNLSGGTAK